MWSWRRVRKAQISKEDRDLFERYGEAVTGMVLANLTTPTAPELRSINAGSGKVKEARDWLTECRDAHERREQRLEFVEWAILAFILLEIVLSILSLAQGRNHGIIRATITSRAQAALLDQRDPAAVPTTSSPAAQKLAPPKPAAQDNSRERIDALESRQKAEQRADILDSDIKALQQKAERAATPPPTPGPSNAPNWIMAFFTVVIAAATVAYVLLTKRLWQETKKSAEAAKNSADVLDRHVKEEADRRKFTVKAGVATALAATSFWKSRIGNLVNLVSQKELPPTQNLDLPYSIAESAALIELDAGLTLSLVLDDMRTARDTIDSVRHINNQGGVNDGPIERARDEAATLLANAHDELTELSAAFDAPAEGGTGN